jgi:hypothetical protein
MILTGGCDANGEIPTDMWHLDLEDMRWEQILLCTPSWGIGLKSSSSKDPMTGPPPAQGGCKGAWSQSLGASIIWGAQGPNVWNELDGPRRRRSEKQALRNNTLASLSQDKVKQDKEERKRKRREEKEARKKQKETEKQTLPAQQDLEASVRPDSRKRGKQKLQEVSAVERDAERHQQLEAENPSHKELLRQSAMETLYSMQDIMTVDSARGLESARGMETAKVAEAPKKIVVPKKPDSLPTSRRPKARGAMPTPAAPVQEKVLDSSFLDSSILDSSDASPRVLAWSDKTAFDATPPFDRLAFDKMGASSGSGLVLRKPDMKLAGERKRPQPRCLTPRTLPPLNLWSEQGSNADLKGR